MKKTMHCSYCCTCPRGAHRNRVDCPGAQALKRGRRDHTAAGCLARCRICGADGHPNIRCPDALASKRGTKRIASCAHKRDGRSSRGRIAPPLQAQMDTWRKLRAMSIVFLLIPNVTQFRIPTSYQLRKRPLKLRNSLPSKRRKLTHTERRVRKRAKYSGITVADAKARDGDRASSGSRKVSGRVSLTRRRSILISHYAPNRYFI